MIRLTLTALTLLVTLSPAAEACHRKRCHHRRPVRAACVPVRAVYSMPVVRPAATAYPSPQAGVQATGDGYGAALAVINAARARHGRGPLRWADDLAAWAAVNRGYHGVMAPGATQAQAWTADPVTAARQWVASPAHLTLILTATYDVGIGASAGGFTANLR